MHRALQVCRSAVWRWRFSASAAALSTLAFGVYLRTLSPTVQYGDGPELTAAALTLGVPHPTGYPLYMLLGHAWTRLLATGDPAWRLNLLSALCTAVAVGLLAATVARHTRSAAAGWLGGGLLAFSAGVWSVATVTEVYALHLCLLVAGLYSWLRWERDGAPWGLRAAALLVGLGLAHHVTTAIWIPALGAALLVGGRRPGGVEALRLAALAVVPLLLYAYLPLASAYDPAIDWGNPETPRAFWFHVSAGQYRGFWSPASVDLAARIRDHALALALALGPFAALAGLGLSALARSARPIGMATAVIWVGTLAHAVGYAVSDPGAYELPAFTIAALWVGLGAGELLRRVPSPQPPWRSAIAACCVAAPFAALGWNFAAQDRSRDFEAHDAALAVLRTAPRGSLLLTQGATGYAPLYASLIGGVRPDVEVIDMFLRLRPQYGREFEQLRHTRPTTEWPRDLAVAAAAARLPGSPPLLLWPDAPDLDWSRAGLVRVRRGVVDELVRGIPQVRLAQEPPLRPGVRLALGDEDEVEFAGARLEIPGGTRVRAGDTVAVRYFWRMLGAPGTRGSGLEVVALLAAPSGELEQPTGATHTGRSLLKDVHPLGQGAPLATLAPDQLFSETLHLRLPRSVRPGHWMLWVGLRSPAGLLTARDGSAFVRALPLELLASDAPRALWSAFRTGPPGSIQTEEVPTASARSRIAEVKR